MESTENTKINNIIEEIKESEKTTEATEESENTEESEETTNTPLIEKIKEKLGIKAYIIISDIISIGEIFAYDLSTKKYQIANNKYSIWVPEENIDQLIIK